MDIQAVISWFQQNWGNIINVVTGTIAVASIIVKFTPTLKDDNILLGVVKFLGKYIALNRTVDDAAARNAPVK